jgi:hypothetical protein
MQQRSLRGNLVLLFAHVTIRNGGVLRDVAHAPDDVAQASIASLSVALPDDA